MNLTKAERETMVYCNLESENMLVTTLDPALIRSLTRLRKGKKMDEHGTMQFELPKAWLKIKPPKRMPEGWVSPLADKRNRSTPPPSTESNRSVKSS